MKVFVYCYRAKGEEKERIQKALQVSGFIQEEYVLRDLDSFRPEYKPFMIAVGDIAQDKISKVKESNRGNLLNVSSLSKMTTPDKKEVIKLLRRFRSTFLEHEEEFVDKFSASELGELLTIDELQTLRDKWEAAGDVLELIANDETYYVYAGEKPNKCKNEYTFEEIFAVLGAMCLLKADEAEIIRSKNVK